jgi:hypothetical protein
MKLSEFLAEQLDGSRDWTLRLIADLKGDDWTFQPAPGLAHPLWTCGHLASSEHLLIQVRCLGTKGLLDPAFSEHFPMGGPVKSVREHDYPPVAVVLETMKKVHEQTLHAIRGMSDALLAEPAFAADGKTPHPHYRDKAGVVAHCSRHEAFHAGQIALVRRLLGKSFLR